MAARPHESGSARPLVVPGADQVLLLLCSDVTDTGPCPVSTAELAGAVRARLPVTRVLVVRSFCSDSAVVPSAARAPAASRVVVGCRHGTIMRGRITGRLREAGFPLAGIGVVDLMPAGQPERSHVIEQSAARLHAAVAGISQADLRAPVRERPVTAGPLSRRSLFHPGAVGSHPVACWVHGRCRADESCRACASACPHGALLFTGSGVAVNEAACTGCGACLMACTRNAVSMPGWSAQELEAAADVLVGEALRSGRGRVHGVMIVCVRAATRVPVGGDWLPLEVPSLEMVSPGWPLQILNAGVGVAVAACGDDACAVRGRELDHFCGLLASATGSSWRRRAGSLAAWEPLLACRSQPNAGRPVRLKLREPAATVTALTALSARDRGPGDPPGGEAAPTHPATGPNHGATGPNHPAADPNHPPRWRAESPVAPLGEISIDACRCSACGICARSCPTAALRASYRSGHTLLLSADPAQCPACGACASACPERAVSLRRVVDSATLTAGRRPVAEVVLAAGRCVSCGQPLAGGLSSSIVAQRLAASHPTIASRLRAENHCADCLLTAEGN